MDTKMKHLASSDYRRESVSKNGSELGQVFSRQEALAIEKMY